MLFDLFIQANKKLSA